MEDRKYSEIEIQTAKNLIAKGYEWITRDKNDALFAYGGKPKKLESYWWWWSGEWQEFASFVPIFPQIKWDDEEPVRLRDIVSWPLTDEEREWLRTVVKPFRDRLKYAKAYDGLYYGRYIKFIIDPPEGRIEDIGEDVEYKSLPVQEDWFKGMEDHKKYAPEELGL